MFRLALQLGRTVRELEQTLDSRELAEWEAYHTIEPLPDPYWIGAQICAVMATAWGKSSYKIADFMPTVRDADEPDDGNLQLAKFTAIINAQRKG